MYQQGKTDSCLLYGLASALAFFGEQIGAKAIYNLHSRKNQGYNIQWNLAFEKMTSLNWVPVKYEENFSEETLRKFPYIQECILTVILLGLDGSVSHSVSICQNFIFDANRTHAMILNEKSLDWCCSAPGHKSSFDRYYKAIYYYPRKIRKNYRLQCNVDKFTIYEVNQGSIKLLIT